MTEIDNTATSDTDPDNLMDLPFDELLSISLGGSGNEFTMRIEVLQKTAKRVLDKYERPFVEIAVEYLTVPRGKRKTKRTRPYFADGELIWEQISDEPGVHYLVTLTRGEDPSGSFYDWTEIVRLDDDDRESALLSALAEESEGGSGVQNDPTFGDGEIDGPVAILSDPAPSSREVSDAGD